ncbi:hypothetical protein HMPREF3232_00966 [Fannyhessea vaginae]|uniref:Uncharacterized protein n=1 Tax=Fannyhessea vaginae DSM 15829 TaxID=525256 RepID=F1T6J0_9ACTN|nr:hypothetical protein HMPREF0091_11081 [Fannyhessea vaginae DSM 15829]KXG89399.1 hypothetical protein HMPREF3232_00966 [Fannyhessea vaginae]
MTGLLLVCLVSDQAWMSSSSALAHEDKKPYQFSRVLYVCRQN